jgi:hypothetical protein
MPSTRLWCHLGALCLFALHRYARVYHNRARDGTRRYYQLVLEVRVDETVCTKERRPESMYVADDHRIDKDLPHNGDIEYLVHAPRGEGSYLTPADGVVVTGLMVRELEVDPATLPESAWWQKWAVGVKSSLKQNYYVPSIMGEE